MSVPTFSFLNLFICVYLLLFLLEYVEVIYLSLFSLINIFKNFLGKILTYSIKKTFNFKFV